MNTPKISVIVPVYNVEKYLPKCIDSILQQTFTDFELLLIDDGSPDNSGKICDEYAAKDSRIRVFHKENGGASSARNLGLDYAKGEWIAFSDSDDYVSPAYLEDMAKYIISKSSLVISEYNMKGKNALQLTTCYLTGIEAIQYYFEKKVSKLSGPVSKLYNRSILKKNNIRFPIGIHMGEDAIFILRYLNVVNGISFVGKCNYTANFVEGSLSSKYYDFQTEWKCYILWKQELLKLVMKSGKSYDNSIAIIWKDRIGSTFNRCLQCLYRQTHTIGLKEQIQYLKSIPNQDLEEYKQYFHTHNLRKKILKFLITHRCFWTYCILGKLDSYRRKRY